MVDLVEKNRRAEPSANSNWLDTGIFDDDRYFDVSMEYAKSTPDDISI